MRSNGADGPAVSPRTQAARCAHCASPTARLPLPPGKCHDTREGAADARAPGRALCRSPRIPQELQKRENFPLAPTGRSVGDLAREGGHAVGERHVHLKT